MLCMSLLLRDDVCLNLYMVTSSDNSQTCLKFGFHLESHNRKPGWSSVINSLWCFWFSEHRGRALPVSRVLPEISSYPAGFRKINDKEGKRLTSGHLPFTLNLSAPVGTSHAAWAALCSPILSLKTRCCIFWSLHLVWWRQSSTITRHVVLWAAAINVLHSNSHFVHNTGSHQCYFESFKGSVVFKHRLCPQLCNQQCWHPAWNHFIRACLELHEWQWWRGAWCADISPARLFSISPIAGSLCTMQTRHTLSHL